MTSALAPSTTVIDRLNAARALLGCVQIDNNIGNDPKKEHNSSSSKNVHNISSGASTRSSSDSESTYSFPPTSTYETSTSKNFSDNPNETPKGNQEQKHQWERTLLDLKYSAEKSTTSSQESSKIKRQGGLDALAMLAFSATIADQSPDEDMHSDENGGITGRSSPVLVQRGRSVSCPEGMEKWDSFGRNLSGQMHFTEPSVATIREEHNYPQDDVDMVDRNEQYHASSNGHTALCSSSSKLPFKKRGKGSPNSFQKGTQDPPPFELDDLNSVALSICSFANRTESRRPLATPRNSYVNLTLNNQQSEPKTPPSSSTNLSQSPQAVIESPTELLKRTRARLLEDLHDSNNNANGEKGIMKMPHMLHKYKEMYNKNGRIGIYTPGERAAIIAKFNSKRTRRVWNKKIRYNCRKNLADRRVRVKGRFVKRSSEEAAAQANASTAKTKKEKDPPPIVKTALTSKQGLSSLSSTSPESVEKSPSNSSSPLPTPVSLPTVSESEVMDDSEDTAEQDHTAPSALNLSGKEKEDAGFLEPTEEQPFRRTRRYTII